MRGSAWRRGLLLAVLTAIPGVGRAAWRSEGPPVATVVDVAVDPSQGDTVYAATSAGGVWRSDDGGRAWTLPGDDLVGRPVDWVEVDPGSGATVWAGVDRPGGPGLWRSLDRGKTWAVVQVGRSSRALNQPIAFAPSNPGVVYVPATNLHFRSADGGKTWESFRVPGQDAYAFAIHPQDPKVVYAGGRGAEHNLSRSRDAGKTWRPMGQGLGRDSIKRLHIDPRRPETLYAVSGFGRVHKTTDAGETWVELELGLRGTEALFSLDLDPHEPEALFAATVRGLRKSADGGATWSSVGSGLGRYLCKGLAFHPGKKGTLYAGTAGTGVYASADGGASFQPSSAGLAAGWTERLYAPESSPGPVFAQMSVGLFRLDRPGAWTEIQAPFSPGKSAELDGVVFDRRSPRTVYAHQASRWWRSDDRGRSWSEVEVRGPGLKDMMKGKLAQPGFKSLLQDPGDPKVFYSGSWSSQEPGAAVFKTTDAGKKWEPAGRGLPGGAVTLLRSVASATVFAVVGREGLYRTSDAGKTWSLVRPGALRDLAVDPTRPDRVFAATEEGLFRSLDAGGTWTRVAEGLNGDDVAAVIASSLDGQVFAGTSRGVFRSADAGATWSVMDGLEERNVRTLAIAGGAPERLYAGLGGGGVYSIELP